MGTLYLDEQTAPDTPPAGRVVMYPKADGFMYSKDDAGAETQLSGATSDLPLSYIAGLVQSQAADTDHDTTISAGAARDSTDARNLVLAAAITKQIDAAWAVGTNAGGMDTGAVGNNSWYYVWLIARSDTGVVDALFSLSATAPTMPTSYDFRRLIGAVKTDGAANIIAHDAYELSGGGLEVRWDAPPLDVNLTNTLTTTARTDTLSVPTAFSVLADINVIVADTTAGSAAYLSCPDQTDQAPSLTASPGFTIRNEVAGARSSADKRIRTSATGTIRARADVATMDNYLVVTYGFEWSRR